MKKILSIMTIALLALTACGDMGGSTENVEGLVTVKEENLPFVAFNIWINAGSQNDPAGKEGLAALTASLLSNGGTEANSYEVILEKLYPMAAGYSYKVDKEMTTFTGRIHIDNLDTYYQLFKEHILAPAFNEADFNRVKNQIMNYLERSRRFNRDEELSKELLMSEIFSGSPYEHPEEGLVQSVKNLTLEDVKAFYEEYYKSSNITVGIGGGYPEGFAGKVRNDFDALPDGEVVHPAKPEPEMPGGVKVLLVNKQTSATAISIGFPTTLIRGDDDFYAMMTANSWLGEHRNSFSHLYQVIRETRGMNYGDYSYIEAFPLGYTTQSPPVNVSRRSQIFEIWIRPISETVPGSLHDRSLFATRAALRELKKLAENGMSEETFTTARDFLYNYTTKYGSTISRRLAYAMDDEFYGLEKPFLQSIRPGLKGLTLEQVNNAIKTHLQTEKYYLVMVTNDAEGMKQKLLSGEPTFITYNSEPSAEIKAEDEEIANFPIPLKEEDITIIDIMDVYEN
jgi:zinc protease